jgi:hypothetical protein
MYGKNLKQKKRVFAFVGGNIKRVIFGTLSVAS